MDRRCHKGLFRTLALMTACALAAGAGWATSTLATGGIAIPGTTITIPTDKNGKPDIAGLILTDGVTLPGGITLPKGFKVPEGYTVPPALVPTTATSPSITPTDPAASTPATTVPPVSTPPASVLPGAGQTPGVDPTQALSGLLGGGTPATTATQVNPANDGGDKAATLLLVLVGGLLLAVALAFAVARLAGWEPEWWSGRRHQTSEAAWRASNTWADFRDWVRPSR